MNLKAINLFKKFVLEIMVIYKMHINIKNQICNLCNSLTESEKLKIENVLINEKNYKLLVICFTNYVNSN